MGESLSIDERCSELEDILQVNLEQLQEKSCEATDNNSNGRSISQNIKVLFQHYSTAAINQSFDIQEFEFEILLNKIIICFDGICV